MIIPSTRLLASFALIVLPLAALAGTVPATVMPAVAIIALFLLIAVCDALTARKSLAGISLDLPQVVRLQRGREGEIAAGVSNQSGTARTVRFGIAFHSDVEPDGGDITTLLPDGARKLVVRFPVHPSRRGLYPLDRFYLEAASRLGLWSWRESRVTACELRVYPNFMEERKQVAALFLNRGRIGIHAHRQAGKGRDFEKLREYIPGDGYDEIHWKASAKRGRPVTKVFQVERTQEVYVILDASRLMGRDPALFERYITAALLLGMAAEQQGDAFGLIAFSDRVRHFARARGGKAQFHACREMLYALQPQAVTPDFDELAAFIRTRLRKRALLVFLTALDDPAIGESFMHAMDLICRQHLILVNMLRPETAQPLFSTADVENTDDIYARLGGHMLWHDLRELGRMLQRRGVRFTLLEKETLSAKLVSQYVNVKAMQLV